MNLFEVITYPILLAALLMLPLVILEAGDENRKLCSLYLGIMDRMGVRLNRFGDAETRLAGL